MLRELFEVFVVTFLVTHTVSAKAFDSTSLYRSKIAQCADTEDNCAALAAMCNNTDFKDIMAKRCPATCGVCSCADKGSYCTGMVDKCNDPNYHDIMTKNCPKTCGVCVGGCVDQVDYCSEMVQECNDPDFRDSMTRDCPKTCGFCDTTGWTYFPGSDSWYLVTGASMTWNGSEAFCMSNGGHLASIHSAEENGFIKSLLRVDSSIGLSGNRYGTMMWTDQADQSAVTYTNFYSSAQSSGYGYMYTDDSTWNFNNGGTSMPAVCKKPNRNN